MFLQLGVITFISSFFVVINAIPAGAAAVVKGTRAIWRRQMLRECTQHAHVRAFSGLHLVCGPYLTPSPDNGANLET